LTANGKGAVIFFSALAACSSSGAAPHDAHEGGTPVDSSDKMEASVEDDVGGRSFTLGVLDEARIGSDNSTGYPYVDRAVTDIDWKQGPFSSVTLIVDLKSTCYPFEQWAQNPPPIGQNWPADCDAFDRNFSVYLEDAQPGRTPYEIVHAITPFGGPLHLEVDITDLANVLPAQNRMRFELVSFSDPQGLVTGSNGGWTVSARIEIAPGASPRHVLSATALFAGQVTADNAPPVIDFAVPAGATRGRIEYRTSGHGQGPVAFGCIGPAEEFCARRHQILVDGVSVENIQPYRVDCPTLCTVTHYGAADAGFDYCLENPCGAIASVQSARANWCPGSMTPPFVWEDIAALAAPGNHSFSFQIMPLSTAGFWFASAIYYAYAP